MLRNDSRKILSLFCIELLGFYSSSETLQLTIGSNLDSELGDLGSVPWCWMAPGTLCTEYSCCVCPEPRLQGILMRPETPRVKYLSF